MQTYLDHVLRIARYARNSDDASRHVRYSSPLMISADWAPAVEAALMLGQQGLPSPAEFFADDAFGVYFLAGYAIKCGRPECYAPLSTLAAMMQASIYGAQQNEAA